MIYKDKTTNTFKKILHREDEWVYYIVVDHKGDYRSGPWTCDSETLRQIIKTHEGIKVDPFKIIMNENSISESDKTIRDDRYDLISTIVNKKPECYDQKWIGEKAAEIVKERKRIQEEDSSRKTQEEKSEKEITRYKVISAVRRYQAAGEVINGLIPNYRFSGGAGKERQVKDKRLGRKPEYASGHEMSLSRNDKRNIQRFYRKNKVKNNYASQKEAYDKFYTKYFDGKPKYPTFPQFVRWGLKGHDPEQLKKDKEGEINFNKDFRTLTGSARHLNFGPGCEAQIDSTKDDTHALSIVIPNTYIGRLTFFMLVDTFSAMPMGVALVPDSSSYNTTGLVFVNSVTPKSEWCASLGIPDVKFEDWPVEHLAVKIFADRGLLLGPKSSSITNNINIQIDNSASYRVDMKAIVERHIGKLLHRIAGTLSGYGLVNKKDSPRISIDTRLQAALNYEDILAIIVKEILYYIKHEPIEGYPLTKEMEACELSPTSLNLWNFGIDNGLDSLLEENPEELRVKILEQKNCSFDKGGVDFKRNKWIPITEDGLKAFNDIRFGKTTDHVRISFDSSDTSEVYLHYKKEYHKLKPIQDNIHVRTFWELELNQKKQRVKKRLAEPDRLAASSEKIKFQQGVIDRALARKKAAGKTVDIKNVRPTRDIDKSHYKKQGPFAKKTVNQSAHVAKQATDSLRMPSFINEIRSNGL